MYLICSVIDRDVGQGRNEKASVVSQPVRRAAHTTAEFLLKYFCEVLILKSNQRKNQFFGETDSSYWFKSQLLLQGIGLRIRSAKARAA